MIEPASCDAAAAAAACRQPIKPNLNDEERAREAEEMEEEEEEGQQPARVICHHRRPAVEFVKLKALSTFVGEREKS